MEFITVMLSVIVVLAVIYILSGEEEHAETPLPETPDRFKILLDITEAIEATERESLDKAYDLSQSHNLQSDERETVQDFIYKTKQSLQDMAQNHHAFESAVPDGHLLVHFPDFESIRNSLYELLIDAIANRAWIANLAIESSDSLTTTEKLAESGKISFYAIGSAIQSLKLASLAAPPVDDVLARYSLEFFLVDMFRPEHIYEGEALHFLNTVLMQNLTGEEYVALYSGVSTDYEPANELIELVTELNHYNHHISSLVFDRLKAISTAASALYGGSSAHEIKKARLFIDLGREALGRTADDTDKHETAQTSLESIEQTDKTIDELSAELNGLVGLKEVKRDLLAAIGSMKHEVVKSKTPNQADSRLPPQVFTGKPGTGKRSVIRLLTRMLGKLELISKQQIITVHAQALIASRSKETSRNIRTTIDSARGGVLVMVDAIGFFRALKKKGQDKLCIETLISALRENGNDFILILVDTSSALRKIIKSEQLLSGEFKQFFEFHEYQEDELLLIFKHLAERYSYHLTQSAEELIKEAIRKHLRNDAVIFENGRSLEELLNRVIQQQQRRLNEVDFVPEDELKRLTAEDVSVLFENPTSRLPI